MKYFVRLSRLKKRHISSVCIFTRRSLRRIAAKVHYLPTYLPYQVLCAVIILLRDSLRREKKRNLLVSEVACSGVLETEGAFHRNLQRLPRIQVVYHKNFFHPSTNSECESRPLNHQTFLDFQTPAFIDRYILLPTHLCVYVRMYVSEGSHSVSNRPKTENGRPTRCFP